MGKLPSLKWKMKIAIFYTKDIGLRIVNGITVV